MHFVTVRMTTAVAVLSLGFLAACGGESDSPDSTRGSTMPQKEITWRLNSTEPVGDPVNTALVKFAEEVSAATKDTSEHVKVTVYPAGQLFDLTKVYDGLSAGQVDLAEISPGYVTGKAPALSVGDAPFLWPSREVLWKALDGEYGELYKKQISKAGIQFLAFVDYGYLDFFSTKRVVKTPSDLKGLKTRLPGAVYAAWGDSLGAEPIDIPGSEALQAMQQGILEGVLSTDRIFVSRKQYEVAKKMTLLNVTSYTFILAANEKSWGALSADTQEAVSGVATSMEKDLRPTMLAEDDKARAYMKTVGDVIEPTAAEMELWEKSGRDVWDQVVKIAGGAEAQELLDAALAARE